MYDVVFNTILHMASGLPQDDIKNFYSMKGAFASRVVLNKETGEKELVPYLQCDQYILFGVEENNDDTSVVIPDIRADKVYVTHNVSCRILVCGDKSDYYALKIKALLWSNEIQEYLKAHKMSLLTTSINLTVENEMIAEEWYEKRGITLAFTSDFEFSINAPDNYEVMALGDLNVVLNRNDTDTDEIV
jgi:hypothetical protein